MIVCSCNVITLDSIRATIDGLTANSEPVVITPGTVYRELGFRPQCGTCLRRVAKLIQEN
jgi:bacterioferritin-associated ferredoxin